MNEMQQELIEKEKEIYKLKMALQEIVPDSQIKLTDFGSQYGGRPTNSFVMQTELTSSQLKNNARRFISGQKEQETFFKEEAEKMAQAAQHSIDTLQRIIDDKNQQLKRKEKIIEELNRELLRNKEDDTSEIQRLNGEIRELRQKREVRELD